ncbi:MAG: hypothetical protein HQL22_09465, partial [Candidatus Omnitrophica bacterium]|nr:hypothetical protein [Candidatus Omnitrophota bacterium]
MLIAVIAPAFAAKTTPAACPNYSKNFDPSPPTMPNASQLKVSPIVDPASNTDVVSHLGLDYYLYASNGTCGNDAGCSLLHALEVFVPGASSAADYSVDLKTLKTWPLTTVNFDVVAQFFTDRVVNSNYNNGIGTPNFNTETSAYYAGLEVNFNLMNSKHKALCVVLTGTRCTKADQASPPTGTWPSANPAPTMKTSSNYTNDGAQYIHDYQNSQCFDYSWSGTCGKVPSDFVVKPIKKNVVCDNAFAGANETHNTNLCREVDNGFDTESLKRLQSLPVSAPKVSEKGYAKNIAFMRGYYKRGSGSGGAGYCEEYLKSYQAANGCSFGLCKWPVDMYNALWGCKIMFDPPNPPDAQAQLKSIKAMLAELNDVWSSSNGTCNIQDGDINDLCSHGDVVTPFIQGP